MGNNRENTLEQALVTVLTLNEDAGLSLDGVVADVKKELGEKGKYRHYCPENAATVCEIVKKAVETVKAKREESADKRE